MPGVFEITFRPSGRTEAHYGTRGLHYELPDGSHLRMNADKVWCPGCKEISDGESLTTPEQRRAILQYMCRKGSLIDSIPKPNQAGDNYRKAIQEEFEREELRWAEWHSLRKSPARCIVCGSTEIVSFPENRGQIPHPPSGEMMSIACIGMCVTSSMEWFFTPDGVRIPRDAKPTYLSHSAEDTSETQAWWKEFSKRLKQGDFA